MRAGWLHICISITTAEAKAPGGKEPCTSTEGACLEFEALPAASWGGTGAEQYAASAPRLCGAVTTCLHVSSWILDGCGLSREA
jgi:hypothetical protein